MIKNKKTMNREEISKTSLYVNTRNAIKQALSEIDVDNLADAIMPVIEDFIYDRLTNYESITELKAKAVTPTLIRWCNTTDFDVEFACEWLEKNTSNYLNYEYNEFHHCLDYDGSVNTARFIKDFKNAMKNKNKQQCTD